MKRRVPLLLLVVLLVAFVGLTYSNAPNSIEAKDSPIAQNTDAGMKVFIDPDTKELVDPPAQPDLYIPSIEDELNLSDEGLIVEDSPVSGEMVNLQGRFQHRYTAGIGEDGKHTAGCYLPHGAKKKSSNSEEE